MPALLEWLPRYLLPSALAIAATYVVLRLALRGELKQQLLAVIPLPRLSGGGKAAALGVAGTAIVLLTSSALDIRLGLPTAVTGTLTAAAVLIRTRTGPWPILKNISWGVLPLVAGLFILVEALDKTGAIGLFGQPLRRDTVESSVWTPWAAGVIVAFASNLMNNLPAGLIAGSVLQSADASDPVTRAVLIGVDLGPNLSVTGSLATMLWLAALRREGQSVGAFRFLKLGFQVMPPALLLALAGALLFE